MKAIKSSKHPLIIQKDAFDRLWKNMLPVGIFLIALYFLTGREYPYLGFIPGVPAPYDLILIVSAPIILVIALFGFIARKFAYVQPKKDRIRVVTPFYQFNVSYRRVRSIRPMNFGEYLSKQKMGGQMGVNSKIKEGSTFWFTLPTLPKQKQEDDADE